MTIKSKFADLWKDNRKVVSIGTDHSVSFPILSAFADITRLRQWYAKNTNKFVLKSTCSIGHLCRVKVSTNIVLKIMVSDDISFVHVKGLSVGDRLVRRKAFGTKHHGIYAGIKEGQVLVAENQLGFGVRYVTLSEFLLNDYSNLARIQCLTVGQPPEKIVEVIDYFLGKPYNLVTFNCEHFAHTVQYGRARSQQAQHAWVMFFTFISSFLALLT